MEGRHFLFLLRPRHALSHFPPAKHDPSGVLQSLIRRIQGGQPADTASPGARPVSALQVTRPGEGTALEALSLSDLSAVACPCLSHM